MNTWIIEYKQNGQQGTARINAPASQTADQIATVYEYATGAEVVNVVRA